MRVERVYTRGVVGTRRSASVEEAAAMMRRYHVGALLVTEDPPADGNAVGILTDRDVVVLAVARGFDTTCMTVGDLMTPTVGTVGEDQDLHEALELMRGAGVRRLAVSNAAGEIVGMLSMDDVVDGIAADLGSLAAILKSQVERERDDLDTSVY